MDNSNASPLIHHPTVLHTVIPSLTCSKDPMSSWVLVARLSTGRTILAGVENRKRPGYCPAFRWGTRPISREAGTCKSKRDGPSFLFSSPKSTTCRLCIIGCDDEFNSLRSRQKHDPVVHLTCNDSVVDMYVPYSANFSWFLRIRL